MGLRTLMVLTILVGAALAGPIFWNNSKSSKISFKSNNPKFGYEVGKKYTYKYETKTQVFVSGDQNTVVKMGATIEFGVVSECEMVMRLRDVSLRDDKGQIAADELKRQLEAHPLRFEWENGVIQAIFPDPEDEQSPNVINIKRAVISLIQHTAPKLDSKDTLQETDVSGVCETNYETGPTWGSLVVIKTKNYTTCSQRIDSPISSFSVPYVAASSPIQNLPLLDGQQECKQLILTDQKIIKEVDCTEKVAFNPFGGEETGVRQETGVKLVFLRKDVNDIRTKSITRRSNLLFASDPKVSVETSERDAREVLTDLCQSTREGVTLKTPMKIGKLISIVRGLPMESLNKIHATLESNQLCASDVVQDMFVDALLMAGTKGPVKCLAKLAQDEKLSDIRLQTWLTMLAFNQNGDSESVRALVPFLKDYEKGGRQAILGISSYIYNLCNDKRQPKERDCLEELGVQEAIAALKEPLGSDCESSSDEQEDRIILALAGFENIGRVGSARQTIKACFSKTSNSPLIRHAAIKAFRRVPCKPEATSQMMAIFKDQSQDAEVRIYAYLGAMRCASSSLVRDVKSVLDKESVNQVGAFVWSHLTNLQETSAPLKQEIREIVNDISLKKKFSTDLRKYSQFIEWSAFSERLNVGGDIEMSLVRSPKAFLPRYASFNLSTQAFGDSLPLLEVGAHMQGLEHYLESHFGTEGVLIEDLLKKFGIIDNADPSDDENEIDSDRKPKSSSNFNRLELLKERVDLKSEKDAKASVYLSLMGRKIMRFTLEDLKEILSIKEAFDFMEILTQMAQKQKVERSLTVQLIDTEMTFPSISGMKMSLAVNGTATVAVKLDGKFDIRKLFTSECSAEIEGTLKPSVVVQVVGILSIDSGASKSGLKAVFLAHSSQAIDGKVSIKEKRVVDVKFNIPRDKVELVTVSSKLYKVESDGDQTLIPSKKYYEKSGCTKALSKPLGIEMCSKFRAPNPLISGQSPYINAITDASFEVTIEKRDKAMKGYELHLELPSAHDYFTKIYKIEMDTPGSRENRHFALETKFKSQNNEHSANIQLSSPIKKLAGSASIINRPEMKSCSGSLTIDDRNEYSFSSEVKVKNQGGQVEYQPSVSVKWPRGQPFKFEGSVSYNLGRKQTINIDLKANKPANKPAFLKGTITKDGDFSRRNPQGKLRLSSDVSFSTPFLESRLHGTFDKQEQVMAKDLALEYQLPGRNRHTVKMTTKIQNQSTRHLSKLSILKEVTFTQIPEYNTRIAYEFQLKPMEHVENELTVSYGENLDSDENKYHLLQVSKMEGFDHHGRRGKYSERVLLEAPFLDHELELTSSAEWDFIEKPNFNIKVDLKHCDDQHITASALYNYKSAKPIEMHIEAKLVTPEREIIYEDTLRERSPNEFEGKTLVQWQRGQRATVDYVYRMKSDSDKTHHEVELKMSSPSMKVPLEHRGLLRVTRDTVSVNSHTHYEGRPVYSIEAHLEREGESKIELKLKDWEAEVEMENKDDIRVVRFDVQSDTENVHLLGSAKYGSDDRSEKRTLEIQGSYNPERDSNNNFQFSSALSRKSERRAVKYVVESNLKVGKYYAASMEADIAKDVLQGPNKVTVDLRGKRMKPISVSVEHDIQDGNMNCKLRYSSDNEEKLQVTATGKYQDNSSELEVSWGVAVKSQYRCLNGKAFHVDFKSDDSSPKYSVNIRAQEAPGKPYNLNVEYSNEESRYTTKSRYHAMLTTPIPEYRSQEATFSAELGRSSALVVFDAVSAQGKRVHGTLNTKQQGSKASGSLELALPIKGLRSVKLVSEAEYGHPLTVETEVHANGDKKAELSLKLSNSDKQFAHLRAMSAFGEKYELKVDATADRKKKSFESTLRRNNVEIHSSNLLCEKQNKNYKGHLQLKNGDWVGAIDMRNEIQSPTESVYKMSTSGFSEPISVTLKMQNDGKTYAPQLTICSQSRSSECLEVKGSYSIKDKPYQRETHREAELRITRGSDLDLSLVLEHHLDRDSFSQKAEAELNDKEIGYEIEFKDRDEKMSGLVRVKMPSRQMLAQAEYEEKDDKMELSAEFLSDEIRQPNRKLELEIIHESSEKDGTEATKSTLEINHPTFERPIKIELSTQSSDDEAVRPMSAQMEIDVSSDPRKKIMVAAYLEKPYKDDSNITAFLNIYHADRKDLDIMLKGHFGDREERLTAGYEWHYQCDETKYEGNSLLEIDNAEDEIHLHSRCPLHQFEAHGKWEYSKDKLFNLDIDAKLDDSESSAKLLLDISKPCVELTFSDDSNVVTSRYHSCVDVEGKSLLTITAESYEGSEKQTDLSAVFDRRSGKVFNAHLHWRPEKLHDILYHLVELSDSSDYGIDSDKLWEKVSSRYDILSRDFNKAIGKPFGQYVIRESKSIARELSSDFRQVSDAWNSLPSWDEIVARCVPDSVQSQIEEIYDYIKEKLEDFSPLSCEYGTMCYKIKYAYSRHGVEGLLEYVYSVIENMPSGYYRLMITLKDLAVSHLRLSSIWEPIENAIENIAEFIEESLEPIFNSEIYIRARDYLSDLQEYISEAMDDVVEKAMNYIESLTEDLLDTPEIKAIVDAVESILEEIEKELEKLHLDQTAEKVYDFSKDFFSAKALKDSVRLITLDPENGQIQVEIRLPAEPKQLRNTLKSIAYDDDEFFPTFNAHSTQLKDVHKASKGEWVPPFKAEGQVVSGMHYKTFDSTFYEFAGQCSYLLAHDFEDGNFTVIMKYQRSNEEKLDKSIVVIIDDESIEVDLKQHTVKISNQESELPIIRPRVTIIRRGETIIVDSRRGLSVTCNIAHDFCSTSISGWYYGKTAGLFGTYDNEQSNDYMRPKGQVAQDSETFARSWEVSSGCKHRQLSRDSAIDIQSSKFDICRDLFESEDSSMSDCFPEDPNSEYLRMCIRQVNLQRNPDEAACGIAAAFTGFCKSRDIDVEMPDSCMKCKSIDGDLIESGNSQTHKESIPQSADVVIIVEERKCNAPLVKDIDSIARLIDRELANSGYNDNRFGVVAFGGKQQEHEAHSHTARGKLFFESKDLVLATEKITYKEKKGESDAFSAIQYAIEYPFRAGVSKSLILLTCSQCDEEYMQVDYSDIQKQLLEQGIILHTLSNRNIQVRGSQSKSKGIYGVDSKTVFRSKDVSQKELEGTPDLRAQVAVPKDVCVALAQEVHGSFFTTKPVTEGQSADSKNWKSVLARRIALSAEPHQCQNCQCDSTEDNIPKTVCKPCKTPSPKVPVKSYVEEEEEDEDEE